MKIRPVGAELSMWTDRQTDRHGEYNSRLFFFLILPSRLTKNFSRIHVYTHYLHFNCTQKIPL